MVKYDMQCSSKWMTVNVVMGDGVSQVYLDGLKGYPACYPTVKKNNAKFRIPLDEFHKCAVTRVMDKSTGRTLFYHRIVAENQDKREMVIVTCDMGAALNRTRRQALPAGFREPESVTISDYIVARAPIPYLSLAVRQNGRIVDTTLNVQPGSLLQMDISLDEKSADTYGLLSTFLKVTDNTPFKEEIIIQNGCAVDPYIFGNFYTADGDYLTAKFRAFKFPNTNFVLFIGTVNVCLQNCQGVQCGNGQVGYGRKRRAISGQKEKAYEVEMTALLKVEGSKHVSKNYPPVHIGSLASVFESGDGVPTPDLPPFESNNNEFKSKDSASSSLISNIILVALITLLMKFI
ncbi:hypothetical protein GQR58_008610 [Nymphon striatum]|nr:hypothetical protein GQR58_008610 [Nymphon striatum]